MSGNRTEVQRRPTEVDDWVSDVQARNAGSAVFVNDTKPLKCCAREAVGWLESPAVGDTTSPIMCTGCGATLVRRGGYWRRLEVSTTHQPPWVPDGGPEPVIAESTTREALAESTREALVDAVAETLAEPMTTEPLECCERAAGLWMPPDAVTCFGCGATLVVRDGYWHRIAP